MIEKLIHNGVLVPEPPSPRDLTLVVRGELVRLTPKQQEMALAWAKKHGTPYVDDPLFAHNFMADWSQALGIEPPLSVEEVNFDPAINVVLREKAVKEALTKEQRKELAVQRKVQREALKEQYGYATVDGERVEIGGYIVEPSGIFMGRGEHPLRGRWKEGARQSDITLNLSPDAPRPDGDWKEFVWQPESLWVARWKDKLSGKLKYIWLSDTAPVKQEREAQKFDKAIELNAVLEQVREKIQERLTDSDPRRKMVATACYLIDELCLRVGDEKDEDEADTVGATTLRPEHVTLRDDGTAEFNFLGKDSVEWNKEIQLPPLVHENLAELIRDARPSNTSAGNEDKPQIFPLISSRSVNRFFSSVMPGLTAKVFRTYHSTETVRQNLDAAGVQPDDPEYKKWEAATQANLVAAELCNHTKQAPANWEARLERIKEREQTYIERVTKYEAQLKECVAGQKAVFQERDEKLTDCPIEERRAKIIASYEKKIARAQHLVEVAQGRLDRARAALEKEITRTQRQTEVAQEQLDQKQARLKLYEAQLQERLARLESLPQQRDEKLAAHTVEKWRAKIFATYEKKIARAERRIEMAQRRLDRAGAALGKLRSQMRVNSEKRAWNLGTSLKSYIDPRVYHRWGQQVDYDVLERYYPKTLQRKFAWVRDAEIIFTHKEVQNVSSTDPNATSQF